MNLVDINFTARAGRLFPLTLKCHLACLMFFFIAIVQLVGQRLPKWFYRRLWFHLHHTCRALYWFVLFSSLIFLIISLHCLRLHYL